MKRDSYTLLMKGFGLHTDWRLGSLGIRWDTELSGASLVLSCHPEDVGEPLQQTFNVQLSVRYDVSEDEDRRDTLQTAETNLFSVDVVFFYLLTRVQRELLISRRSTQYPTIGLPLSFGSFQVTSML